MRAVRVTLDVKTTNPLNGGQGRTAGAAMAEASRRRKQREQAHRRTQHALWAAGHPVRVREVPAVVRKGVVVRPAFGRRVIDGGPWRVELVRLSAGRLDDDGLRAALKSVRDGIADALDVDDGDRERVTWLYAQRKCKRGQHGVEVTVTAVPGAAA